MNCSQAMRMTMFEEGFPPFWALRLQCLSSLALAGNKSVTLRTDKKEVNKGGPSCILSYSCVNNDKMDRET